MYEDFLIKFVDLYHFPKRSIKIKAHSHSFVGDTRAHADIGQRTNTENFSLIDATSRLSSTAEIAQFKKTSVEVKNNNRT